MKNLSLSNTMLAQQQQELLEVLQGKIFYNELGLESLHARRWYRKLCYLYKFYVFKQPECFFNLIPVRTSNYRTRNADDIPFFNIRHNFFKYSFFPPEVIEQNKLNSRLQKFNSGAAKVISGSFFQDKPILLILDSFNLYRMENACSSIFEQLFGLFWDIKKNNDVSNRVKTIVAYSMSLFK